MVHLVFRLGFLHVNRFRALDKLGLPMRLWLVHERALDNEGRAQLVKQYFEFSSNAMAEPSFVSVLSHASGRWQHTMHGTAQAGVNLFYSEEVKHKHNCESA